MIEIKSSSEIVEEAVIDEVIKGNFVGVVPTYKELSIKFGVSKPVVASALHSLNRSGVLRSDAKKFVVQEPYGPKMETDAPVSDPPLGVVFNSGLERFDKACPVSCEASSRVDGEYDGELDDEANLSHARELLRIVNTPVTPLDLIEY